MNESISQKLRYLKNGESIVIEGVEIFREKPVVPTGSGRLYHIGACGMKAAFAGPIGYESAFRNGWRG